MHGWLTNKQIGNSFALNLAQYNKPFAVEHDIEVSVIVEVNAEIIVNLFYKKDPWQSNPLCIQEPSNPRQVTSSDRETEPYSWLQLHPQAAQSPFPQLAFATTTAALQASWSIHLIQSPTP